MINKINVDLKRLKEKAIIPTYGSAEAAGADLYACLEKPVSIKPHHTVLIGTGWAMQFPVGMVGLLYARSGLASKQGLRPANCVGICDSDYRGEIMVALHNHSSSDFTVNPKDRIAQLVIVPYLAVDFCESDELSETVRADGGFGSTGK